MLSPTLPDGARLWVFTANRTLSDKEVAQLRDLLQPFITQWTSHGRPVPGEAVVHEHRFVLVGAHLQGGVSGCGIDSLVHAVEAAGDEVGVEWVDGLNVVFRDADGAIRGLPRAAFRQLARDGAVTAATPVFDTTVGTVGALRRDGLERPAGAAWHGRVFRLVEPV